MWKWLAVIIGCILLLQGCVSDDKEDLKIQGKEREGVNEQLIQAAERKETETISRLIEEGADINTQDSEGRTATMIATYNNDVETAKILITAGADVNIQDDMKNNPFLYAGAEGYLEILKLTINAGADTTITNRYGGTALIPASEHGYVNVIKELLTNTDIDINHVNNLGWTALLEAIILSNGDEKQQQTVQLLIDHGADVNIADHNNVTPLQHAREKGFKEIEQILTKEGAK
ncbi:ankyrin repeat domain-containing protein [Peribacillus butanolivorans]|uniref:ankyrin repeat domain-containing protein n=1 Tax=Peribacillus butanolivorans TaxID=421767 RepID=UPI002E1A9AB4|nr:ankyrin repeat domain-containing protein [Peribacillus butanolivorans]MED3689183.1 ankyrin repeat domain-containing protein [Peribacillus butanolivorans]